LGGESRVDIITSLQTFWIQHGLSL